MGRNKVMGKEVYWTSDNGNIVVTYDPFGLGSRFSIYRKILYQQQFDLENFRSTWAYVISFTFIGEAYDYAKNMEDITVYRYINELENQEVISA